MNTVLEKIIAIGIMPVIAKLESAEDCSNLAAALEAGGVPAMEITFRMANAERYIRQVREQHSNIVAGAGTVLTIDQARKALDAGAQFIVAPGLNPDIVRFCQEHDVPVIPGVATPSEIEQAMSLGLQYVKFFPAEQMGGINAIKAMSAPYKTMGFMPTGGLNLTNIADYFAFNRIIACGGTYMIGKHLERREWSAITDLCRKSVQIMLGFQLAHVGVNASDEGAAAAVAAGLTQLLMLDPGKDGSSSVFAGTAVEVMKHGGLGANGHIGFRTPCLDRAVRYLKAMGVSFREDTAKYAPDGSLKTIYFAQEIGSFAIHLVQA